MPANSFVRAHVHVNNFGQTHIPAKDVPGYLEEHSDSQIKETMILHMMQWEGGEKGRGVTDRYIESAQCVASYEFTA